MSDHRIVSENSSIKLNFSLSLEDGSEIDSNFEAEPVAMKIGDGNMLPGFERCLLGLKSGESIEIVVQAADAFGEHNGDNLQSFKASDFSSELKLEPGLVVSFADPAGGELPGVVNSIDANGDRVEIDFNHPLAGRNIIFRAAIHSIVS